MWDILRNRTDIGLVEPVFLSGLWPDILVKNDILVYLSSMKDLNCTAILLFEWSLPIRLLAAFPRTISTHAKTIKFAEPGI
jgi:hypothetical protein